MTSKARPTWVETYQPIPSQQFAHTDSETETHHDPKPYSHAYARQVSAAAVHKQTFLQRLAGSWLFEWLGLLVSAASLAATVLVLRRYDGQRIPDWGPLSFNTLISILTLVSKMAALYGATSAISQLKWVWFAEHGKSLLDYKIFDSGSRGVAGATMLAWTVKGR